MLPGTSLIMGFRYRGSTQYVENGVARALPFSVVAGLRKSIQFMRDAAGTANLLVIFNEAGASVFLEEPLFHLFGEIIALHDCEGFKAVGELEEKLSLAAGGMERITLVEQFLLAKLNRRQADPLVLNAMQLIREHQGFIKIKALAARLHISLDAFEKRFRRVAGASPKQFANIVRMNALVSNIRHQNFIEAALDAGYYDQAHFNKDFKLFTGQTPTDFLKNPTP
jgi:AraC-like DNA-binding protein